MDACSRLEKTGGGGGGRAGGGAAFSENRRHHRNRFLPNKPIQPNYHRVGRKKNKKNSVFRYPSSNGCPELKGWAGV